MAFHWICVELEVAADDELLPERTTPSTTPTITTAATMPPISHQRRSTPRATGAPFERTGAGFRDGGGPRPCLRRLDALAIRRPKVPAPCLSARAGGTGSGPDPLDSRIRRIWLFRGPAPSDARSSVRRPSGHRSPHRRRLGRARRGRPPAALAPRRARRAPRARGAGALGTERRRRPAPAGGRRDDGPPPLGARHESRPAPRQRTADERAHPLAARRGDEGNRRDERARKRARPPRAGTPPAEGARRVRRAAAREPTARPAPARRVPGAV